MSKTVSDSYTKVVDLISENAILSANITTHNDIRIDGVVNGNVTTTQRLVIGPKAVINGNISAKSADCFGKVTGNITVETKLNIKSEATIKGAIEAALLSVELGASICGDCRMGNSCK